MAWTHWLAIALGGAVGALLRALVTLFVQKSFPGEMPWGTITVNVLGCLMIGIVAAAFAASAKEHAVLKSLVILGLLGSFTTFSTFAFETLALAQDRQWLRAGLNLLLSNGLGLAAAWAGFVLTAKLLPR